MSRIVRITSILSRLSSALFDLFDQVSSTLQRIDLRQFRHTSGGLTIKSTPPKQYDTAPAERTPVGEAAALVTVEHASREALRREPF